MTGTGSATGPSRRELFSLAAVPAALVALPALPAAAAPLPRPAGTWRNRLTAAHSLDGLWKFRTDPYSVGEADGWAAPDLALAEWEDMPVPGVWDVMNHHAHYVGEAWYRTEFATDPAWTGKLVRLKFDGVYNDTVVWLNGRRIGTGDMGYLPFQIDLAGLAPPGRPNRLAVRADNRFKLGATWNWGGIRRPVSIEVTEPSRLERIVIVGMPDLPSGRARVTVDAHAVCHRRMEDGLTAQLTIRRNGRAVWQSPAVQPARRDGRALDFAFAADLSAEEVRLWSVQAPNLYEAEVVLLRGDAEVHAAADRFGIRHVAIDGDRLLLNGEPIRAVGFNLVPEDRRTGSALPPSRYRADIDRMRMLGATMARLSHFPLPGEVLDYLDEVGMLTLDEVPIWGQNALVDAASPVAASWLSRLIDAHRNHPSVIGWCVGNEIGYFDRNPGVRDYVRTAIARAKVQDPSRMAVYVTHSAANQPDDPVEFSDMIFMNAYGDIAEAIERTRRLHPGKPIFVSEYGNALDGEDPNATRNSGDALLGQLRGRPYVMGGALWTFADYRSSWAGHPGSPATPPSENRAWGILTVDRRPKRSYHSFRTAQAPVRALSVEPRGGAWAITLAPRLPDDLPAASLAGYRLLWRVAEAGGRIVDAGVIGVPAMAMGAAPATLVTRPARVGARTLVDLVDPGGYSVLTAVRDLQPPARPAIRAVHSSARTLRAIFDPLPHADEHVLICAGPDGETRSAPTINGFAEVGELVQGTAYSLRLVALNGAGESEPSAAVRVVPNHELLPPILWSVQSADRAAFLNYSAQTDDYFYDVEVTHEGGAARMLSVSTSGTTRIPGLENGRTYNVRMRRCDDSGFRSAWSAPVEAVARGPGDLPAPTGGFAAVDGDGLMLVFDTVENAAAYEVAGGGRTIRIDRAASGIALLPGVSSRLLSVRAIDDHGRAGRAAEVRTLGA